ncbi:MAG: hypothetical protein J5I62_13595 [Flavobacteriales bacterium]|nr:hypothetical protein [Flavobacteriales bacterium]MEB2341461.1 hypothetical protein [Flavobacteriia bacterium]
MTFRSTFNWSAALVLAMGMAACGGGGQTDQGQPGTDTLAVQPEGGLVKLGNKVFSIPSPVQTVLLIRELKTPYEATLPLPTDSAARFAGKQAQALALGVYGADMAYVTAYGDGQRALKTLKAVEQLATQLNISNAFDKALMARFQANVNNMDSLLRLSGTAFRAADMYLKNDQREDISTHILAGGWVEGLYLTLGTTGSQVDPKVAVRLAEQRHTLDNLIELLERDAGSEKLVALLKDLATSYNGVTSEYTYVEPTVDAANKTTYINSTSKAEVPPGALGEIIRKVRAIRAAIIA